MDARSIRSLLADADAIERDLKADPRRFEGRCAGRVVANLFFEDSTRTRTSFTIAARRLGADCVDLASQTSSVNKGETLIDTARAIEAMGVGAIVVRARQSGAAALIARHVAAPVINAGDGRHEHPTQALLDILTIARAFSRVGAGATGFDLSGLRVAIVGDVVSSRVARSNIAGLTALGARVACVGPASFAPASLATLGCDVSSDLEPVVREADAVMMLRIQFERHADGSKAPAPGDSRAIASIREYRELYAMTEARARLLREGAIVMHPGPMNRGIEVDAGVADGPRSVITRQVSTGVVVRMAVLARALRDAHA